MNLAAFDLLLFRLTAQSDVLCASFPPCCTVMCSAIQFNTMLCSKREMLSGLGLVLLPTAIMPMCGSLIHTAASCQCCSVDRVTSIALLCCAMLSYAVLFCVIVCYAVLCCSV